MEFFKKNKKDLIVVGALVLAGLVLLLVVLVTKKDGTMVTVNISGKVVAEFPLSEDLDYVIETEYGGTNHLIIKDGYAWLSEASCPDGICVNMGKINTVGQSVICLPNEVVVEITGDESDIDLIIK